MRVGQAAPVLGRTRVGGSSGCAQPCHTAPGRTCPRPPWGGSEDLLILHRNPALFASLQKSRRNSKGAFRNNPSCSFSSERYLLYWPPSIERCFLCCSRARWGPGVRHALSARSSVFLPGTRPSLASLCPVTQIIDPTLSSAPAVPAQTLSVSPVMFLIFILQRPLTFSTILY